MSTPHRPGNRRAGAHRHTVRPHAGPGFDSVPRHQTSVRFGDSTELGPRKIRVNAINPGMVETEGFKAAGLHESDFRKQAEAQTPLGRIGQPEEIAPAAVFLASSDSAWITGETLHITGGLR